MQMRQFAYEIQISWNPPDFRAWNPPDFMMKSAEFHAWNPPNFMHEIHWISWNSPDFMKSARFHEISRISCMKSARFHEICRISCMKSAEFHEIRWISWNPPDFMYFPNEPRTNGPIFSLRNRALLNKQKRICKQEYIEAKLPVKNGKDLRGMIAKWAIQVNYSLSKSHVVGTKTKSLQSIKQGTPTVSPDYDSVKSPHAHFHHVNDKKQWLDCHDWLQKMGLARGWVPDGNLSDDFNTAQCWKWNHARWHNPLHVRQRRMIMEQ